MKAPQKTCFALAATVLLLPAQLFACGVTLSIHAGSVPKSNTTSDFVLVTVDSWDCPPGSQLVIEWTGTGQITLHDSEGGDPPELLVNQAEPYALLAEGATASSQPQGVVATAKIKLGTTTLASSAPAASAPVTELSQIHPVEQDFVSGKEGRILISTAQDNEYHAATLTSMANGAAQVEDARVKITAYVNPKKAGITVYFRVVDPDPDDLSSYESNANGGDNRDSTDPPANKAGSLSSGTATTSLVTINGVERAAAEVVLTITNCNSGDNYVVEASTAPSFANSMPTVALVAWKRCYLERDYMYKKGATVTVLKNPDGDANDDVLDVDATGDFAVDDQVTIFLADGTTIDRTIKAKTANTVTVADLAVAIPKYSGVKLKDNNDTYTVSTQYLGDAYGSNTSGTDGGAFVEFVDISGGGNIPKYETIPSDAERGNFFSHWFAHASSNTNVFQLAAGCKDFRGKPGATNSQANISIVFVQLVEDDTAIQQKAIACSELAVHEIGHQFVAYANHVDTDQQVDNHASTDKCIMTLVSNLNNGVAEFCATHLYEIRDASDPS